MKMGAPSPIPGVPWFVFRKVTSAQPRYVMQRAYAAALISESLPRGLQVKNKWERGKGKPPSESYITSPAARKKKIQIFSFSCAEASWWVLHRSGKFLGSWIIALLGTYLFLQLYGGALGFKRAQTLPSSVGRTGDLLIRKGHNEPFLRRVTALPLACSVDTAGNCSAQRQKLSVSHSGCSQGTSYF